MHWKTAGKAAVASLCVTACQACAATPAPVRCNAVSPIPCNTNTLQYLARNQLFQIYRPRYIPRTASLHSIIILQYIACKCIFIACDPQGNRHSWILVCGDIYITAIQSQGLCCFTLHRFSFISMIGKAVYAMGTVHLCISVCLCCISTW